MNPLLSTMKQAVAGMELQSRRIGVTSENISNADTPGFQRKVLVPQSGGLEASGFQKALVTLDQTEGAWLFDPSHPMANEDGYVQSSNVSIIMEMADLREANRTYEANLNAFQQAKSMYASLLDVLRR